MAHSIGTPTSCDSSIGSFIVSALVAAAVTVAVLLPHVHRSAFYDEAWMIEAARQPDAAASIGWVINEKQPVAIGFLMSLRWAAAIDADSPWPYRVPAMLATVVLLIAATVVLTPVAGRREWACLAAITLLACPMVQRYGTEIKQYIVTAAASAALLAATVRWCAAERGEKRAAWVWFITALFTVLLTFGGWFLVAASGLFVAVVLLKRRAGEQLIRATVLGAAVIALMATLHLGFNRHIAGSRVLTGYWREYYVPVDAQYPLNVARELTRFLEVMWYRYSFPPAALLAVSAIGWLVWTGRRRAAGGVAIVMLLATLAANAAKLWPLGPRLNLHLLVLLHLSALVLPLSAASWAVKGLGRGARSKASDATASASTEAGATLCPDRAKCADVPGDPARVALTGQRVAPSKVPAFSLKIAACFVIAACLLGVFLHRESRGADYQIAALEKLQLKLAEMAADEDVVVLTPAPATAQRVWPAEIRGTVHAAPWPSDGSIERDYLTRITMYRDRRILIGVGHDQPNIAALFDQLGAKVAPHGVLERRWSDQFVAIYVFTPRASTGSSNPPQPSTQTAP